MLYGGIEAGGTKMICVIGNENGEILDRMQIPTKTPEETMPLMIDYFKDKDIKALGIACFGPIDLDMPEVALPTVSMTLRYSPLPQETLVPESTVLDPGMTASTVISMLAGALLLTSTNSSSI